MALIIGTDGNDVYSHSSAGGDDYALLGGNDRLNVFAGTVRGFMGEGDDFIDIRGGNATVYGESGEDQFVLVAGGTVYGGGDNDLFSLNGGTGTIADGGEGDDRFNFGAIVTSVMIRGGAGADTFSGYDRASTGSIYGDSGNDSFTGFRSGITLYGGGGNDVYRVNPGSNATFVELVDDGKDTVQLMRGGDFTLGANIENLVVGTYAGSDLTSATITGNTLDNAIQGHNNDETINGLGGNDRLYGKGGADLLNGGDGNDILDGGSGNDTLNGGAGNDRLNGRVGDDLMTGGTGDDIYYIDSSGDTVIESAGEGTDTMRVSIDGLILSQNVEIGVIEGSDNLWLFGNAGDNILFGNSGNNRLGGNEGNDTLNGGGGNDQLFGDFGDDILNGGAGDDAFWGYQGADVMTGGAGADTFNFFGPDTSESTPTSSDSITDFTSEDTIDLRAIDADTATPGDQAFSFTFSTPAANSLWFSYSSNPDGGYDGTWFADVNGDTIPELQFNLHWDGTISVGDATADIIL